MESNEQMIKEMQGIKFAVYICVILLMVIVLKPSFSSFSVSKFIPTDEKNTSKSSLESQSKAKKPAWSRQLAQDTFAKGQEEKLVIMATERIKEFPNDPEPYWYRAKAYVSLGQYEDALRDLDRTEAIAPQWLEEYIEPLRKAIIKKISDKQKGQ